MALLATFFALRAFVGDVFTIASGSMRPTLWDADSSPDRVFVTFVRGAQQLERFDLVVLRREDEHDPFVKRAVGLPGETVLVRDGDLFIDGKLVGAVGSGVLPPVSIFDMRSGDVTSFLAWNADVRRFWTLDAEGVITLDPRSRPIGTFAPALRENVLLEDDYLETSAGSTRAVGGRAEVGDLALALELWAEARVSASQSAPCGTLRATLTERGDAFHCSVQYVPGAAQISLSHAWPLAAPGSAPDTPQVPVELASAKVEIPVTGWQELTFQNVDNVLSATWNGAQVWRHAYDENTQHAAAPGSHQLHRKPRFALSGHGKDLIRVRALRLARDLVYTSRGTFATRGPLTLGPDEVFLLGDNSSSSRDSREWGPVPADDLVGRVRAIVWPWARRKSFD